MNATDTKVKAIDLIRQFFGCTLQELKALTAQDRNQLASAIARVNGLTQEQCAFTLVKY